MIRNTFFFLVLFFPLSLQAQVYRCAGADGPVYSQMPCAENAERLTSYDPVVDIEPETPVEAVEKQPTAMESFVVTLHNQRQLQMGELDENIARLQELLDAGGEQAADEPSRAAIASELASLKSERDSISDQYTSLISEAERRAQSVDVGN